MSDFKIVSGNPIIVNEEKLRYLSFRISTIRDIWVAGPNSQWINPKSFATDIPDEVWRIDTSEQPDKYVVAFDSWKNGLHVRLESHSIEWIGKIVEIDYYIGGGFEYVVKALRDAVSSHIANK